MTQKDSDDLVTQIETLLKQKKRPLKARTISRHLNIHKSVVNKLLYSFSYLFRKCEPYEVGCGKDKSNFAIWTVKDN